MNIFLELVKKNKAVKAWRVHKWKKFSRKMLFTKKEIAYLEKHPESMETKVKQHIKGNPFINEKDLMSNLDNLISASDINRNYKYDEHALKNDMMFWYLAYGFTFNEYLCYEFINKSSEQRRQYLSDRDSVILGYDLNDIDDMMLFGDKMRTYSKYCNYYGREVLCISSKTDYDKYKAFISQYSRFVKKNPFESCGRSVELIDLNGIDKQSSEIFNGFIAEGKTILEEVIRQSENTSIFNESSVNTVRCITLSTERGVVVPYCFMKIGRNGAFIDNGGAGGILVGIDPKTGVLYDDGVDEAGIRYVCHPDSGVAFAGYKLTEWETMIRTCIQMAEEMKSVRLIGWDMAHTDKGWIVVEGNAMTEVIGPQSTLKKGIRKELLSLCKG